jgi:hypothetical protein
LGWLYRLQEQNFRPRIWDKVRNYWERFEEHIGNFENMLGTHLKLDGNTMGTERNPTPLPSLQEKKPRPP